MSNAYSATASPRLINQAIERTKREAADPFAVWNLKEIEWHVGQCGGISKGWIRVCAEQRLETLRGLSD